MDSLVAHQAEAEIIETVARNVCLQRGRNPDDIMHAQGESPHRLWQHVEPDVRVVLQALYEAEPTERMLMAAPLSNRVGRIHVRTTFRAMLGAALQETDNAV